MTNTKTPLEGKIVIIKYTECDSECEGEACLVYKVINGRMKPLLGILNLSDECYWPDNDKTVLKVIQREGVTEVYCPQYGGEYSFLNFKLGFTQLSEGLNEMGEVEEWCEFDSFHEGDNDNLFCLLEENGIQLYYFDIDTLKVVAEDEG